MMPYDSDLFMAMSGGEIVRILLDGDMTLGTDLTLSPASPSIEGATSKPPLSSSGKGKEVAKPSTKTLSSSTEMNPRGVVRFSLPIFSARPFSAIAFSTLYSMVALSFTDNVHVLLLPSITAHDRDLIRSKCDGITCTHGLGSLISGSSSAMPSTHAYGTSSTPISPSSISSTGTFSSASVITPSLMTPSSAKYTTPLSLSHRSTMAGCCCCPITKKAILLSSYIVKGVTSLAWSETDPFSLCIANDDGKCWCIRLGDAVYTVMGAED
ncbi:hypothetical protein ADUPG1_006492 [Aduncisulcus paluster]|nr:hypothetical protein ADUPG1_006492 [Aduncisulcus paluster]